MAKSKKKDEPGPMCPECRTPDPLPIRYGLPSPRMTKAHDRGEIALGGCCIGVHNPRWKCRGCGLRYRDPGELPLHVMEAIWNYEASDLEFWSANDAREKAFKWFRSARPGDADYAEMLEWQGEALRLWVEAARALEASANEMNLKVAEHLQLPAGHSMRTSRTIRMPMEP